MDMIITRERLAAWRPCERYTAEYIAELIPPGGVHLRDALKRTDVPAEDLIWMATRKGLLPDAGLRLFACRCARRALDRCAEPDQRSLVAVKTAERYALGAATADELAAARDGAWSAWMAMWGTAAGSREANVATWAAARPAKRAAEQAQMMAEWAAADATAERVAQIADLLAVIDRMEAPCEP